MRIVVFVLITAISHAGTAEAGGIMRDTDRSQVVFEKGKHYLEFSSVTVSPTVSGRLGVNSGNISPNYQNFGIAYKTEVNDKIALAIIANEPVGADIAYPTGTGYIFAGSTAEVSSTAITGLVKYDVTNRVSAYGGLRLQALSGNVNITFPVAYTLSVSEDYRAGYVLGAAYRIPEIALKLALTYESEIEHEFEDNTGADFKVKIPQAVTLHAQSGVAKDTLVFGSARWQEWTKFEIRPLDFLGGAIPIASEPSDILTYEIGLGRRFSENWSGALTVGYEEDKGDIVGNLSAKDGYLSYGIAAKYQTESWEITMGLKYFEIGDTFTSAGAFFSDNDAIAGGIKVGLRF